MPRFAYRRTGAVIEAVRLSRSIFEWKNLSSEAFVFLSILGVSVLFVECFVFLSGGAEVYLSGESTVVRIVLYISVLVSTVLAEFIFLICTYFIGPDYSTSVFVSLSFAAFLLLAMFAFPVAVLFFLLNCVSFVRFRRATAPLADGQRPD
jgi:hypothetical protein